MSSEQSNHPTSGTRLFARGSWPEASRIADVLRRETVGGIILFVAAAAALIWANSPWSAAYDRLSNVTIGPESLHLNLTLSTWAADGLLAVFFFVVGLELKREFVAGDLRNPAKAALPVVAAVGGMVVPALIFVGVQVAAGSADTVRGWAVPTATDIAFAVAVLAVLGSHLPLALRTFLLTLAVVDDLLAITVIAVFYTETLNLGPLLLALIPGGLYALAVRRGVGQLWILLPLGAVTWAFVHASGVHATIAGVVLGFTVPVIGKHAATERLEHLARPVSAGLAIPVFAFFAAGVTISDIGFTEALREPVTLGVLAGLVLGKPIGVLGTTYLLARFTRARLDDDLAWRDVLGVSMLAGIGFTVSLLIGELAFGAGTTYGTEVKIGVLCGSLASALLAATVLLSRNATYRRIAELEARDDDRDGVPDVYQRRDPDRGPTETG